VNTHRNSSNPAARREAGAVMLLVAIALLMLVGLGALAIDGSHIYMVNTECQATADAAAVAAAYMLPDQAASVAEAIEYAQKNMRPGDHGNVIQAEDVVFGSWDFVTRTFTPTTDTADVNAVRVTAHRTTSHDNPLQLTLANALGFTTADIARTATAAFGTLGTWDLALAQDVTDSFVAELHLAKDANHSLLECFSAGVDPDSTFGVVTFTGWGQSISPMLPIGSAFGTLSDAVDDISNCGTPGAPPCSGTDIAAGLASALQILQDSAAATPGAPQAIVIVTDGLPKESPLGSHPTATFEELKTLASQQADTVWSKGVSIFVVFYDEFNDAAAADFLSSLVRGGGSFLSTPDPEELPDLLSGICGAFGPLRLVE
jgi:Flp pilus assembly protein TadG